MSTDTMPAAAIADDGCTAERHGDTYAYTDFKCRCAAARKANAARVARHRATHRAMRAARTDPPRQSFVAQTEEPTPGFHFSRNPVRSCAPGKVDDQDMFFDESAAGRKEAKKVCRHCPVKAACLQWALETRERFGVWGETSSAERLRILERRTES